MIGRSYIGLCALLTALISSNQTLVRNIQLPHLLCVLSCLLVSFVTIRSGIAAFPRQLI